MIASAMAALRSANNRTFSESVKWFCRDAVSAMRNQPVSAVPAQNRALSVPSADRSAGVAAGLTIRCTPLALFEYSGDTSGGGAGGPGGSTGGRAQIEIQPGC